METEDFASALVRLGNGAAGHTHGGGEGAGGEGDGLRPPGRQAA